MSTQFFRGVLASVACLLFFNLNQSAVGDGTQGPSSTNCTDYQCITRGPHSKIWQRAVIQTNQSGIVRTNFHSYTELATGLCYLTNGQYVDSVEQIDAVNDGAQATQGRHKIHWMANANTPTGAVTVTMPDNKTLSSSVYGLAYYDTASGSNVLLTQVQDSIGNLTSSNTVIYTNAFSNLTADIRYTYSKAGLSQDIVMQQQPPSPAEYGMDPRTTRLEVITEFFAPPCPTQCVATNEGLPDCRVLNFGEMRMGVGRAFLLQSNSSSGLMRPVIKEWTNSNDRTFLMEEVPYPSISNLLNSLHSSTIKPEKSAVRRTVLWEKPGGHKTAANKPTSPKRMASLPLQETGFILDYDLSGYTNNITFQGDTTYYVSGEFGVDRTVIFEGGTVVKYASGGAIDNGDGDAPNVVFQTSAYRPAVFTSCDDNSVGDVVSGSTGIPSPNGGSTYLITGTAGLVQDARFSYAGTAVYARGADANFQDCQFLCCQTNYLALNSSATFFRNVLVSKSALMIAAVGDMAVDCENVTIDSCSNFFFEFVPGASLSGGVTNSIFTGVGGDLSPLIFDHSVVASDDSGIFQTVGAASYYLSDDSTNQGAGTTDIDTNLLADLSAKTTYPPLVLTNGWFTNDNYIFSPRASRDNLGTAVDLGYHYDSIDYATSLALSNADVDILPGTTIAGTGTWQYAFWAWTNSSINCVGTATNPVNLVRYNTVQEQSTTNWETQNQPYLIYGNGYYDTNIAMNFQFTHFSTLASSDIQIDAEVPMASPPTFQDCQFFGGQLNLIGAGSLITNCLLQRVNTTFWDEDGPVNVSVYNSLFWAGEVTYNHIDAGIWIFRDNLFDSALITTNWAPMIDVCSNNAYVTTNFGMVLPENSDIFLTNSPDYETGTMGKFYYPTGLLLIHAGSRTAGAAALYHYTVTADNAIDGTNKVSIGFHYVAADSDGVPLISNTNGIFDYLADANGNGIVDSGETPWNSGIPVIVKQPSSLTNLDGTSAVFSIVTTGPPPLSFQWYHNGTNLPGATGTSFTISDVQIQNAGSYIVTVTNNFGGISSDVVTLSNVPSAPVFVLLPISQTVVEGDMVTFTARAIGTEPISYQWRRFDPSSSSFTNLDDKTNCQLINPNMGWGDEGTNAILVSNSAGTNSITNVVLTDAWTYLIFPMSVMPVIGPRQDYTFQYGITYYICSGLGLGFSNSPVDLYGTTTIQGGAVLKFDFDTYNDLSPFASLALHGSLKCQTGPYNPAILTSADDSTRGFAVEVLCPFLSEAFPETCWLQALQGQGWPTTDDSGYAYLNLDDLHSTNSATVSNLLVYYADAALTIPTNTGRVDVWDCQFVKCNNTITSHSKTASTNALHNVLFANCTTVFSGSTNIGVITGEQVTADVDTFWNPLHPPSEVCLTNSIIEGEFAGGPSVNNLDVSINPSEWPFEEANDGAYYLTSGTSCRGTGSTSISSLMREELQRKTTSAPIVLLGDVFEDGQAYGVVWTNTTSTALSIDSMTLFPVAKRYTAGPPDVGYYYDPLDYSVADAYITNFINVLPGTAIGFRNDYGQGIAILDGSSFTAIGSPTNRIILADIDLVQEGPITPGSIPFNGLNFIDLYGGIQPGNVSPILNLRFCDFYATPIEMPISGGNWSLLENEGYSWSSSVHMDMEDCKFIGGQIVLGEPGIGPLGDTNDTILDVNSTFLPGSVLWKNNEFYSVNVQISPSYTAVDSSGNNGTPNIDLPIFIYNNLFKGGAIFEGAQVTLDPVATSEGNWKLEDNLFDQIFFMQNTNQAIDADHNAYWMLNINPLAVFEGDIPSPNPAMNQYFSADSSWQADWWWNIQLLDNSSSNYATDQILAGPPPYTIGPWGGYYLPPNTLLHGNASRTADAASLCQYTTRLDQTKEMRGEVADIGLHYVAASNGPSGWIPLDSDGDGIPDYVEDANGNGICDVGMETSITSQYTITGIFDSSNSVYTNIDLDGDGMVGVVESALNKNPLAFDNPLALFSISTSPAPGTNVFKAYVAYSAVTNIGGLELLVDGCPATNQQFVSDIDGNSLLIWITTTNTSGASHYLQAQLMLNGSGVGAAGPLLLFNQPLIAIQNTAQTNGLGGTVIFTTTVTGPGPYTYQWQHDGTNISGATGSSLTISNLIAADQGNYTVIVSNQAGDPMDSSTATLVVSTVSIGIIEQPLSQTVFVGDTVTFGVTCAQTNLTYQWQQLLGGTYTDIANATNCRFTLENIPQFSATYAVVVTAGTNSIMSQPATLTSPAVVFSSDDPCMPIIGPRQDYTFQSGVTYLIGSPVYGGGSVDLYGTTTVEAATVIKFDLDLTNVASLIVHGNFKCKAQPYRPAMLTSIDDDSEGETVGLEAGWYFAGYPAPMLYESTGYPQDAAVGSTYLNLDDAQCAISITNLRVSYADHGVTTPTNFALDIWDSQFYSCHYPVSVAPCPSSTNGFHNVLFADCDLGIYPQSTNINVTGEQITADVGRFCDSMVTPSHFCLTNSIIFGEVGGGSGASLTSVETPSTWPFQSADDGNYYLPPGSPCRHAGTTNISVGIQTDLANKSTCAPISFLAETIISGQLALFPQASRETNGPLDLGYHYPVLDYTIADMYVPGGSITILPGVSVGFRNDYFGGLGLTSGAFVSAHGTPTKPIVFTDNILVQEGPHAAGEVLNQYGTYEAPWWFYGGPAFFVPSTTPDDSTDPSPGLDFRFCNFYMSADDFAIEAGYSLNNYLNELGADGLLSVASSVVWKMNDCNLYGGQVILGAPVDSTINAPGSVSWTNNLFEDIAIVLDPADSSEVDLPIFACNNLFEKGFLFMQPVTTSAGNWEFRNNLFDREFIYQDPSDPLDYDHNAYSTNGVPPLNLIGLGGELGTAEAMLRQSGGGSTNGAGDIILQTPPEYQSGAFGDHYITTNSPLIHSGSTTADQLGFYHYTSITNQSAQSNSIVNIGLQYLCASNSLHGWIPMDTDQDGIPDYIEDVLGNGATGSDVNSFNETDWLNPKTDGVNYDPSNEVYLNVDLAGNGIAGRIATNLNLNPLVGTNPLTLTQIITGLEPDIVTFEVPLSYNYLTNVGELELLVDGDSPLFQNCEMESNGLCCLAWNLDYSGWGAGQLTSSGSLDANVTHYLQAKIILAPSQAGLPNIGVVSTSVGPLLPFTSEQLLEFESYYGVFDTNGATFYATLMHSNAEYTVDLYDDVTGDFIIEITNSTTSGLVSEDWGGTNSDGSAYLGDVIDAVYTVDYSENESMTQTYSFAAFALSSGGDLPSRTQKLNRLKTGVNDGAFLMSYANAGASWQDSEWFADERGAVDALMQSSTSGYGLIPYPYGSTYNAPDYDGTQGGGQPGLLLNQDRADQFTTNFGILINRNFFWDGHGASQSLTDGSFPPNVEITATSVAGQLHNHVDVQNGTTLGQPYRFVFLNACDTADDNGWCQTFGIVPHITEDMVNKRGRPQAFLGWHNKPKIPTEDDDWLAIQLTYNVFFYKWQIGRPLAACVQAAESPNLSWPLNKKFTAEELLTPNNGIVGGNNFYLRILGYPGITRTGYSPGY